MFIALMCDVFTLCVSVLEGGPLKDKYKIAQFHLHWGKTSKTGSEHTVNGMMYSAEVSVESTTRKLALHNMKRRVCVCGVNGCI